MSLPWTPDFTARILSRITDARLAEITPLAFYTAPVAVLLPLATAERLIDEERARRANARRNAAAVAVADVADVPTVGPAIPPSAPAAPPIPRQASLFE